MATIDHYPGCPFLGTRATIVGHGLVDGTEGKYAIYFIQVSPPGSLTPNACTAPAFASNARTSNEQLSTVRPSSAHCWTIERRFSSFVDLKNVLDDLFVSVPKLPGKTFTRIFSSLHLETRQAALDTFLKCLTSRADIMSCPTVHSFLGIFENCPNIYDRVLTGRGVKLPDLPASFFRQRVVASLSDPNFGVHRAYLVGSRDLLITAANDFSLASKVDSMVSLALTSVVPEETKSIPQSRLCVWHAQNEPQRPFGLKFVQYFSKRISQVAYTEDCRTLFVGFETGDLLCYRHKAERQRSLSSSSDSGSLIDAFYRGGQHMRKETDLDSSDRRGDENCVPSYYQRDDTKYASLQSTERSPIAVLKVVEGLPLFEWGVGPQDSASEGTSVDLSNFGSAGRPPQALVIGTEDGFLMFYSLTQKRYFGKPHILLSCPKDIVWLAQHSLLIIGMDNGAVEVLRLDLEASTYKVETVAEVCPAYNTATPDSDIRLALVDAYTPRIQRDLPVPALACYALRGGPIIVGTVNSASGAISQMGCIAHPSVSPTLAMTLINESILVLGGISGVVSLLRPQTGEPLYSFRAHSFPPMLPPGGINLFGTPPAAIGGHAEGITALQWVREGSWKGHLLTAARDGWVKLWKLPGTIYDLQTGNVQFECPPARDVSVYNNLSSFQQTTHVCQ